MTESEQGAAPGAARTTRDFAEVIRRRLADDPALARDVDNESANDRNELDEAATAPEGG